MLAGISCDTGQSACRPCGSSAVDMEDRVTCRCIGAHRTFSPITGRCVCQSGYVFFDEASLEESEENSDVDCLPKVRGHLYCIECTQLIIQVLPLFSNSANQFTLLCSISMHTFMA